jgi:hypothetical protein
MSFRSGASGRTPNRKAVREKFALPLLLERTRSRSFCRLGYARSSKCRIPSEFVCLSAGTARHGRPHRWHNRHAQELQISNWRHLVDISPMYSATPKPKSMGEMVDNALACTQSGCILASIPGGPLMDMLEVIDSGPVELLNRDWLAELAAGVPPKQRRVNVECPSGLQGTWSNPERSDLPTLRMVCLGSIA